MPKRTFLNLSKEKQDQIFLAALNEFSQYTFREAKISNIINKADIPRSSFYDYFEDKTDLYRYMIQIIKEDKMKHMDPVLRGRQAGFFEKFRELFIAGAEFAFSKPEYENLLNKVYEDLALAEKLLGTGALDVSDAFYTMLTDGVENGEIRADIDKDFVAKALYVLSSGLIEEDIRKRGGTSKQHIVGIADKMMEFVKFGITNN